MRSRILLAVSLFLVGCFASFAQDDAYKLFLKRTSVAIHKAQKTMLANNKTDVGGKLAKAVLLQTHAVKLYAQKKQGHAVCSSSYARQLAAQIIKDLTGKDDALYAVADEEKKLMSGCSTETEIIKESSTGLKTMSTASDKDYTDPKSLNKTNIDPN